MPGHVHLGGQHLLRRHLLRLGEGQPLCSNLVEEAARTGEDVYMLMNREAAKAPVGVEQAALQPQPGRRYLAG